MEFSLDDNRAGAGSSILLSPEVLAIRAKLIEACDGKTFAETIEFLKQLLAKEEVEQKGFPIINEVNRKMEKILRKHKGDSK